VRTGEDLLQRVARLEVLVPVQNDVLTVSSNFIAIAESSGVVLESFAPSEAGNNAKEETAARVLRGTRYGFDATGDFDSLIRFLENIVSSRRFVATLDSLSVTSTSAVDGMFSESARVGGEILVWSMVDRPLTNPVVTRAPIGGGSSSVATTVPSTVTTLPPDPSVSPTTLPSAPTTLPSAPTTVPASNEGTSGLDPRFDSCEEAIAEGFGPYVEGDDPEYEFYVDEDVDGEGVVCAG
jgi:hypothetical protein